MGALHAATRWSLCGWIAISGCSADDPAPATIAEPPAVTGAEPTTVPDTREAFLASLVGLPAKTVVVVYEVKGPAGLQGTLEVLARHGGYRRDNWRLQLPTPSAGEPISIVGSTVQTPDVRWTEGQGARAVPLGALADAYLETDATTKAEVMRAVESWHAALRRGRAEQPGTTREIAGVSCLRTRVAEAELCVWEQAGLPLAYEGPAFSVTAVHVERDSELGDTAFELPDAAAVSNATFDAEATLRALAGGDVAALTVLTQPGLALPDPETILAG